MKIRSGFVSNSSSSSFILPVEANESGEVTITLSVKDLVKYITDQSNSYDDETRIDNIVGNIGELNHYFVDHFDLDPNFYEHLDDPNYAVDESKYYNVDDYIRQEYEIGLNLLKEGKHIIFGSVSYNDYFLSQFLNKLGARIDY